MKKRFKVVRYVPTLVFEDAESGNRSLVTSPFLFENIEVASKAMSRLIKLFSDKDSIVIRSCIICKTFEL